MFYTCWHILKSEKKMSKMRNMRNQDIIAFQEIWVIQECELY